MEKEKNVRIIASNMRLWSIHPRYLDAAGLVALWREGLLARKALSRRTTGYRRHPQLERFKLQKNPAGAMNAYLLHVWKEARRRGYNFDRRKIGRKMAEGRIGVSLGQIKYEFRHLKKKLRLRNPPVYRELLKTGNPEPHPLFRVKREPVESWERTVSRKPKSAPRERPASGKMSL